MTLSPVAAQRLIVRLLCLLQPCFSQRSTAGGICPVMSFATLVRLSSCTAAAIVWLATLSSLCT